MFDSLPSLVQDDAEDLTDEEVAELEAEAKKDRIAFHRTSVRNGPVKFGHPTSGQLRRQRHRDLARQTKRGVRGQRKQFFANRREHAVLRGVLQAVGVVEYETTVVISDAVRFRSATWILNNFGAKEIPNGGKDGLEADYLRNAVQAAFNRFSDLSGIERSPIEYA